MTYSNNQVNCIRGTDISFSNQGTVDFVKMKNMGCKFVILRTVRSNHIYDNDSINNYLLQAKAQNLYVGSYHFVNPETRPGIQGAIQSADEYAYYLELSFSNKGCLSKWGDIHPVIDIEIPVPAIPNTTAGKDAYIEWIDAYFTRFKEKTGLKTLMFYSASYVGDAYNGFIHSTKNIDLKTNNLLLHAGNAEPYNAGNFSEYAGFTDYTIWQYSSDGNGLGSLYGVSSADIDLDLIRSGRPITDILIGGVDIYAK